MRSYTTAQAHSRPRANGRQPLPLLPLFLTLAAVLSVSGCTGLTGAGKSTANSPSNNPAGTLNASATSLSFGNVMIGSNSSQNLTLSNTGNATVAISQAAVTGSGFSILGGTSSVSIAAGQTHTFQVQFAPTTPGSVSGAIAIASDATNPSLVVSLSGTGMTSVTITSQPQSQSVAAGQSGAFSVVAAGSGTLTYQWRKNGSNIGGATAPSYTTPATTISDNRSQFSVVVTDGNESVTSNPATLTVAAATFVLNVNQSSLSFGNVTIGNNNVLPVTLTDAGNSGVTISNVVISGAGFTTSGVSSGQILTAGQKATLNVTFAPSSAGSVNGTITVASNATNSPAVISLSGTGVQPVSHSVAVSWTASTSTVSGYNIYRSQVSGGPYAKQNSALVAATTYTDSNVSSGVTYFYVVTAVDSGVESLHSSEASATVP